LLKNLNLKKRAHKALANAQKDGIWNPNILLSPKSKIPVKKCQKSTTILTQMDTHVILLIQTISGCNYLVLKIFQLLAYFLFI